MSLQVQFFTFFMMFSSGWTLGMMFDLYRVVTRPMKLGRWMLSLLDLVFWMIATVIVFRMLYISNHGELRSFVFIALLIGTWFYFYFISSYMIIVFKFLVRLVVSLYRFIVRCVQILIIRPLILLYKLLLILLGLLSALSIFIFKIVVQLLYPFWFVIKWLARGFVRIIPWPAWVIQWARWLKQRVKRLF